MTTAAPMLQRESALIQANQTRLEIAALKKAIRSRRVDVVAVIRESELPITVYDVLSSIPRVGHVKVVCALRELGLSEHNTLGGYRRTNRWPVTERQREALAAHVAARIDGQVPWRCT